MWPSVPEIRYLSIRGIKCYETRDLTTVYTVARHCSSPCTDRSSANPPVLFNIHLILCSYLRVDFKVVSVLRVFFKKAL